MPSILFISPKNNASTLLGILSLLKHYSAQTSQREEVNKKLGAMSVRAWGSTYSFYTKQLMPGHILKVDENNDCIRLDIFLTKTLPWPLTRTAIKKMIDAGNVHLNGEVVKAHHKVCAGDEIAVAEFTLEEDLKELKPENIPLDIFYEDQYLLVVNKPVGMLVHPARGTYSGTLVNALLFYSLGKHKTFQTAENSFPKNARSYDDRREEFSCCRELSDINASFRPGIVHRLDRETSGLMLVAKDTKTHVRLARQFKKRQVKKKYVALVKGKVEYDEGIIDVPLGSHDKHFDKQAVSFEEDAKEAKTFYRVLKRFAGRASLVELFPQTGRMHQIRVHMAHLGHPILGDEKYGAKNIFFRMALHSKAIAFVHPIKKYYVEFSSLTPKEFFRGP